MNRKYVHPVKKEALENFEKLYKYGKNLVILEKHKTTSGLSTKEEFGFRRSLKQIGARCFVIKNNLAKIYLKQQGFDNSLVNSLKQELLFIFHPDIINILSITANLKKFTKDKLKYIAAIDQKPILDNNILQNLSQFNNKNDLIMALMNLIRYPIVSTMRIIDHRTKENS